MFGFVLVFWGLRSVLHHLPFFPSFNDDLGTMPTRRPHSWKKNPLFNVTPIQGGKSLQLLTPTERTVAYITELRRDDNFLQCHTIQKDFFANLRESWREPYPV